ncbi:MAG: hypothetical protein M1324_01185 [Patescibacteria group bacterium]|nr:hypothetical protein [Patescibacteria group bacterium]
MSGRKPIQPIKIKYEQAKENFSPEKIELVYDFVFKRTIEDLKNNSQDDLDKLINSDLY